MHAAMDRDVKIMNLSDFLSGTVGLVAVIFLGAMALLWFVFPLVVMSGLKQIRKEMEAQRRGPDTAPSLDVSVELLAELQRHTRRLESIFEELARHHKESETVGDKTAVHLHNLDAAGEHTNALLQWIGESSKRE